MRILVKPHKSPICCKVLGPSREAMIVQLLNFLQAIHCRQDLFWHGLSFSMCSLKHVLLLNTLSIQTSGYNNNCNQVKQFVRGKNEQKNIRR